MIRASYTAQGWDNYIHIVVSQLSLAKNMSEKSAWPLTLYRYAYLISINIRLETRDVHPLLTEHVNPHMTLTRILKLAKITEKRKFK